MIDEIAQARCDRTHQRALGAIAIAAASEDGDHTSGRERPRRLEQVLQRIVGMGVIDDHADVVAGVRDDLKAAGHVRELGDAFFDRAERHVERHGRRGGREYVVGVRTADQWRPQSERAAWRAHVEAQPIERKRQRTRTHVGWCVDRVGHRT